MNTGAMIGFIVFSICSLELLHCNYVGSEKNMVFIEEEVIPKS